MERRIQPQPEFFRRALGALARAFRTKGRNLVSNCGRLRRDARVQLDELYITLRRAGHRYHEALAGRRYAAPTSFLALSAALGLALTVTTLYTTSYAVFVDGENVGAVADQSTVEAAVSNVEAMGSRMLGYEYTVDNEISYKFALTLRSDLSEEEVFEDYFSTKMDQGEEDGLRLYEIVLDGQVLGVIESKAEFNNLLQELKSDYTNENTTAVEFVEEIRVNPIHLADEVLTIDQMRDILTENTTGETTYTVVSGDTYSEIAQDNEMTLDELMELNPQASLKSLFVGDVLTVKRFIPYLPIITVESVSYDASLESPVEYLDDDTMYEGNFKVITQGTNGMARVNANVTYLNGYETERTIVSSETLTEPTVTYMARGTAPRPKTASNGYYIWPCQGWISSRFGWRNIFGGSSFHGGLDIANNYGTTIVAADGGLVTYSGWNNGGYGYLVVITHDDGSQTYYGHNSSLLVNKGERVWQGQAIAKMGSTGRSTGNHCHFEIRINGERVNPENYL